MARIRTIKPEFWQDELIASWPMESRLVYIALWNEADDEGRLRASTSYLRSRLFPYDLDFDISQALLPIINSGKLTTYQINGQWYGVLPKLVEHQVINKPSKSKIPAPLPESYGSLPVELPVGMEIEGKGKEQGKGREQVNGNGRDKEQGKEKPPKPPLEGGMSLSDSFESFWKIYPERNGTKGSKQEALERFQKLRTPDVASVIQAARNYAAHCRVTDTFPRDAARFLAAGRKKAPFWREFVDPPKAESKVASAADLARWNPVDGGLQDGK